MKKRILFPIVLLLALVLTLTACDGFKLGKKIESITITGGAPTEVLVGETPDFSQIKILATYNDLSTVELGVNDVQISAVDTSKPGKVEYTITYDGKTITASLEVKVPNAPKPGDTTPVAPTLTALTYRSGLKSSIYKGDVYDTSALTVTATYSDNSTKIVEAKDLKFVSEIDPKKVGEQTLEVAYESLTLKITVTVMEILPVGIEVDAASVDTTVPQGVNPDISGLKVYLCYNNGDKHLISATDSKLVANNFPDANAEERDWVITYDSFSATVKLSSTPPVVTAIQVNGGYPTWVLLGETYSVENLTATATLSNNLTKTVTGLTISAVDTTTAGKKTVTATYTCEDGVFASSFEIDVVTVVSVTIDTGSFKANTTIGKFDASGLRVDITLSNGEFIERTEGVTVNYFEGFDKDSVCEGEITATFQGVTSAAVKVTIVAEDFKYLVAGVSDPDQLAQWKNDVYSNNFLDGGYGYVVGSNNPFRYTLTLSLLDPTTYLPVTEYLGYTSKSEVLLNGVAVGTEYVTIDEENHTFQFTKAAEGKTFVIKTRPDDIPAGKVETFTKTLEVTVVDAYNVHDAKELNVMTNKSVTLGNSGYDQLAVVNSFLANNGITRPEVVNGIVLHNNFTVTRTDLPAEYFITAENGNTYIWDHQSIYYHEMQSAGTFNFYGNYFTINTYNIPIVAPQGTQLVGGKLANDDNGLSSSEIFRFNVAESLWYDPNFNHTNYVYNFYALGMNDNDESVSVEELVESQRHMLGVYAFKTAKAVYNFNAVNATRYYITAMPEYDCQTVNLNYTKFYDAWQSHINTWTRNDIDDKNATTLHANHVPATININNSFVGKAGGPAILCMNANTSDSANSQSKNIVNIDDNSEVFSYVVGNEAWFTSHGISSQAMEIGGIDYFFNQNGVSYKTQLGENTNGFMNMVMITMDADYIPGLNTGTPSDIDGICKIGDVTVLDMDDYDLNGDGVADITYGNQYVFGTIVQSAQAGMFPPVFASSEGGVGYYDGSALNSLTGNNLYQGDYLTLYYYNLGIVVGYNEGKLPGEPTPPAAPWNTEARVYF